MKTTTVHLGFEVGTGADVSVPLAHTFVTGQTQLSGKTTTLEALVTRSGRRAVAFATKRGERLKGRPIKPYLPRRTGEPVHWRFVETLLASALGTRALKYERYWLIAASKGATSLADVRRNVARLLSKSKGGRNEEVYTLIGEYLDLVLPDMEALDASEVLILEPGLNVMDLVGVGPQLQALVIRATMHRINHHEHEVLTVFPEAWEFAPRGRMAPAKEEATAMARKGGVIGNFLLCDSQDIAGVETDVRQAASVWILGVQRELNELARTIKMMPAGTKKPKPEDVSTLGLGQFYVCTGAACTKTYVRPAWMTESEAKAIAVSGVVPPGLAARKRSRNALVDWDEGELKAELKAWGKPLMKTPEGLVAASPSEFAKRQPSAAEFDPPDEYYEVASTRPTKNGDDDMTPEQEKKLDKLINGVTKLVEHANHVGPTDLSAKSAPAATKNGGSKSFTPEETFDNERLYQAFKARLIEELSSDPRVMAIVVSQPELRVRVERAVIEIDGSTLRGRVALMIREGVFDAPTQTGDVFKRLQATGFKTAPPQVARELGELTTLGFLTRDNKWYRAVAGMKRNVEEA